MVLLLLKAKAHLNIRNDKAQGKLVSDHDATKHRNDVFSLSYLLDGQFDGTLEDSVKNDIETFLSLYDVSNPEWQAILSHLTRFGRQPLPPIEYLDAIRQYYQL